MNTIATINDILLPVVLFVIYFIFASVVQYNLKGKTLVSTSLATSQTPVLDSQQSPETFTYKDAFSSQFDPDPREEISASVQPESVEENIAPVIPQKAVSQASSPITAENRQSIAEIIDRYRKRELRKLCSPLGIQQKTNGTELTTELMKALVKRKFKENPQMVFEVMEDRLPHLLLSTLPESNQQQPSEKKAC
jgi:hypothetical protein